MDYNQILDYIRQQGAVDNAGRDSSMYNVPGFSSAVQVLPNGQLNYADPSHSGFNRMGTGLPTDYSYEQKNGLDPDFIKFALAAGGLGAGFGTGLLGGMGETGAAGAVTGEASGAGLGGMGGAMGQAGDYGMGALAGDAGAAAATTATTAAAGGGGIGSTLGGIGSAAGGLLGNAGGMAALGGLLGAAGSKGPDSTTATSRTEIDPRIAPYIYGDNGILSQIMGNQNRPQAPGLGGFGTAMDAYLGDYGRPEFDNDMRAAGALRDTRFAAPQMQAAQVQAPGQNDINLTPAYQDMVFGAPGANPYLTSALQGGIHQSKNAFDDMLGDATRSLTQDILPNIRGGAQLAGQYGGSRQALAERSALQDFSTQIGRASTRFGQGNTDAIVGAQAGAYDTDRNRALNAMSGLGAQQYGVAGQDAQFKQQAGLANMDSTMNTNRLNMDNLHSGVGLSSGLLGQAYGYGANQDQYPGQKVAQTAGLLSPFTGLGASQQQTQPLYHNTAGGILGGAVTGLGLWNAMNKKVQ